MGNALLVLHFVLLKQFCALILEMSHVIAYQFIWYSIMTNDVVGLKWVASLELKMAYDAISTHLVR